jgi:hypothetical protein
MRIDTLRKRLRYLERYPRSINAATATTDTNNNNKQYQAAKGRVSTT